MPFLLECFSVLVMSLARGLDVLVFAARVKAFFGDCFTVHLIFMEFQLCLK